MSKFITRVELHKVQNRTVTAEDYALLHQKMRAKGFITTITSDDNITYELPPAEYRREGMLTREVVFNDAKAAAQLVVNTSANVADYSLIIFEYSSAMWYNLSAVPIDAIKKAF